MGGMGGMGAMNDAGGYGGGMGGMPGYAQQGLAGLQQGVAHSGNQAAIAALARSGWGQNGPLGGGAPQHPGGFAPPPMTIPGGANPVGGMAQAGRSAFGLQTPVGSPMGAGSPVGAFPQMAGAGGGGQLVNSGGMRPLAGPTPPPRPQWGGFQNAGY